MRSELRLGWVPAALALLLGCGDYSNLDLEFFSALPTREDIKSNLPEEDSGTTRSGPSEALRTALVAPATPAIGATSKLYTDTRGAADVFKAIAETFVRLIDDVQRHPPSTRDALRRTWGPFPIAEAPGFEFLVVIARDEAAHSRFDYSFGFRPEGSAEEVAYTVFFSGNFVRTEGQNGIGSLQFDNTLLRDSGLQTSIDLDWLTIDYDSRAFPRTVRLEFSKLLDTLTFEHAEYADDSGSMHFVYQDAFAATFDIQSRWTHAGSGRADASVSNFFGPLGTVTQCWNGAFLLTFHQSDFEAPNLLGAESACIP